MSTSDLQATDRQNAEELDTVKESISDIINQLQDIDPTRLSFSPFLDLDTQISLAPVSDSPESSVEELRSASHSVSGSQRSLEPPPVKEQLTSSTWCHQQPSANLPAPCGGNQTEEEEELDQTLSSPIITSHSLDATMENCRPPPLLASQGDIPNGTNTTRWSPESTNLESTVDESRPLIGPTQESVELAVWTPEGLRETATEADEPSDQGRCCCRCCQCKCSQSRLPAFFSVLASLLCAAGMLYALYFYVPIRPPDCPDVSSRIVFTFCCCTVAALPVLLAMLMAALCQLCSGSLGLQESTPRRHAALQQLFVTSSLEQLLLYILNLVTMATLLNQEQLKLVPILVIMFIIGRLVFWFSLNTCSSWRGFGSGLTFFPLLAMVALNLFLMYNLNLKQPLIGSQDVLYNQVTPSSWSGETSQSPSGKPDVLPTDILDAQ